MGSGQRDLGRGEWRFPLPFGCFSPNPLDWVLDYDDEEDSTLVLLDAVKEDFLREVKVVRRKIKGKRELLNLESYINYGNAKASAQRRKGKTHVR